MLSILKKPGAIVVLLLTLAALAVAACGDDDDADAQSDDGDLEGRVQRVEVLSALNTLDATGFHAIDEELQEADEIPEFTASGIETALRVSSSTDWPEPLAEKANTLNTTMADFIAALEAEELQDSKGLATDTHDAWHELEHDAYAWVAGEELEEEEDEGEDGESEDEGEEESPSS